ncbi:MAG: OB-fold nucleic acid binding domain-containing protein [Propionibacteriaceae bacterium]|nr:OB-fold nucleic acid binding domain-containing protein [Propionibacteriaceae bacterium]
MSKTGDLTSSNWRTRLRQALSSDDERESMRLLNAALTAGASPLAGVKPRQLVTVRGQLMSVTLMPVHGAHWVSAELSDGSGTLNLIWMGRRTVPGITPGATLTVTGRVTLDETRHAVMYNPCYELGAAAS